MAVQTFSLPISGSLRDASSVRWRNITSDNRVFSSLSASTSYLRWLEVHRPASNQAQFNIQFAPTATGNPSPTGPDLRPGIETALVARFEVAGATHDFSLGANAAYALRGTSDPYVFWTSNAAEVGRVAALLTTLNSAASTDVVAFSIGDEYASSALFFVGEVEITDVYVGDGTATGIGIDECFVGDAGIW